MWSVRGVDDSPFSVGVSVKVGHELSLLPTLHVLGHLGSAFPDNLSRNDFHKYSENSRLVVPPGMKGLTETKMWGSRND